jgi:hypothetical protein
MLKSVLSAVILLAGMTSFTPSLAQSMDVSPVLLIESGPSDNPEYRRMVFVKYLSGESVNANYKAYNRTEFAQVPNSTPASIISECARGNASSLSEIQAFQRDEARLKRAGQPAKLTRFCIKNISNWEGGGRTRYLDPIFEGMPYAAILNN